MSMPPLAISADSGIGVIMQHGTELRPPGNDGSQLLQSPAWGVSVAFWVCLLLAATMYSAVALAPKLSHWIRIRQQYEVNAARLAQLDADVEYLERVAHALESDPDFATRLAEASRTTTGDQDVLPVSDALLFGNGDVPAESTQVVVAAPYGASVVQSFATDRQLRFLTLSIATLLTVFGFTFLNDSDTTWLRRLGTMMATVLLALPARYRRSIPPETAADTTQQGQPGHEPQTERSPPAVEETV